MLDGEIAVAAGLSRIKSCVTNVPVMLAECCFQYICCCCRFANEDREVCNLSKKVHV